MRMWNVDPEVLCLNHILGEHAETHMFLGTIKKGTSVKGYINNGLLEIHNLKSRHEELKNEMIKRGMNHNSEFGEFESWTEGYVDSENNLNELKKRCEKCYKRILDKNI